MKCEKVKKQLELIYEGGEPGAEALSHVKKCSKCRAEYDMIIRIKGAVSGMEDVKCPPDFNRAVWARIGEPAPSLFGNILKPVFALSAAAAAALVVFMVFFAGPGIERQKKEIAVNPPAVKEQLAEKKAVNQEEKSVKEQAPVLAKDGGEAAPAPQEVNEGVSPGNMPELIKSAGADKDIYIKTVEAGADRNMAAVSYDKGTPDLRPPLTIKNNVIKPLSGQGMTILYKTEGACNVSIKVYNRKGELIKTLYQGTQGPGMNEVTWMGEDENSLAVGDGIYVVHIKTCLVEEKIKAMVVK